MSSVISDPTPTPPLEGRGVNRERNNLPLTPPEGKGIVTPVVSTPLKGSGWGLKKHRATTKHLPCVFIILI